MIIHCYCPSKLEVSCVVSGYRSCPFTIIKQNNNHNTQNTDSISRIQWSCCVYVIMLLIICMYFCALFNLVSSYLRNMMENHKYAEDTSKKKRICCVEQTRNKQVTINVPFLCWSFISAVILYTACHHTCRHHNPFKRTLSTAGNLWRVFGRHEWLALSLSLTHTHLRADSVVLTKGWEVQFTCSNDLTF